MSSVISEPPDTSMLLHFEEDQASAARISLAPRIG